MTHANETFLTDKQIAARYSVHKITPWNWARKGAFPQPVKLTSRCTRWRLSDVLAWEQERQEVDHA